ncbi:hypothetical protein [Flavisolibacter nicotianae]|nr:hypothetical protein [Flavisolibacter nicotianae]
MLSLVSVTFCTGQLVKTTVFHEVRKRSDGVFLDRKATGHLQQF